MNSESKFKNTKRTRNPIYYPSTSELKSLIVVKKPRNNKEEGEEEKVDKINQNDQILNLKYRVNQELLANFGKRKPHQVENFIHDVNHKGVDFIGIGNVCYATTRRTNTLSIACLGVSSSGRWMENEDSSRKFSKSIVNSKLVRNSGTLTIGVRDRDCLERVLFEKGVRINTAKMPRVSCKHI